MSEIKLNESAARLDLSVDDGWMLAEVKKAGRFCSSYIEHNKSLRRLAEQGLIDLDAPTELHGVHIANAKTPRQPR